MSDEVDTVTFLLDYCFGTQRQKEIEDNFTYWTKIARRTTREDLVKGREIEHDVMCNCMARMKLLTNVLGGNVTAYFENKRDKGGAEYKCKCTIDGCTPEQREVLRTFLKSISDFSKSELEAKAREK